MSQDDFIRTEWGKSTADRLKSLGVDVSWTVVPRVHHEMVDQEIEALTEWIVHRLSDQ